MSYVTILFMSNTIPMVFLDSGDPTETRKTINLLGKVDGQTTNPSLVVKNPEVSKFLTDGKKFSESELLDIYKKIILEIREEMDGPLSVEVNASWNSTWEDLLRQAESMSAWTSNINIKFPTTNAGVKAAQEFVARGGRVNMTLVFDQIQAAAVYVATKDTKEPAFISPFMGRWDDRGYAGVDLVRNIRKMYDAFNQARNVDSNHVKILAASIRTMDHLYASLALGADILTIPLTTIEQWLAEGKKIPGSDYVVDRKGLKAIEYQELELKENISEYDIVRTEGTLLDEGLKKFAADWNSLLE